MAVLGAPAHLRSLAQQDAVFWTSRFSLLAKLTLQPGVQTLEEDF
jgi:hypothetical protein